MDETKLLRKNNLGTTLSSILQQQLYELWSRKEGQNETRQVI